MGSDPIFPAAAPPLPGAGFLREKVHTRERIGQFPALDLAQGVHGWAGAALAVSAIGSFIAGSIGVVGLTLFALPLAEMAIEFGPAEYFMLMLFAMTSVASLTGKSLAKGMFSMVLGLMLATVGIDLQSAMPRFTMDIVEFQEGISFVVVVVGMFAVSEVFQGLEMLLRGTAPAVIRISGKLWLTREEWRRSIGPIWRGGIIGFIIGVLPGAGGTIASILSYTTERGLSKHPEQFGKGQSRALPGRNRRTTRIRPARWCRC